MNDFDLTVFERNLKALKVIEKSNTNNAVSSETNKEETVSMPNNVLTALFYAAYFALSLAVLIELSL